MPYDAAKDPFRLRGQSFDPLNSIGRGSVGITPSDTVDLTTYGRVVLQTAGDVRVLPAANADPANATAVETRLYTGLPAGYVFPFLIRRVLATGTTATVATVD
jgi:hypothetical protein